MTKKDKEENAFEVKLAKALKRQGFSNISYEDDESGMVVTISHVDALAKTMWKMSLGYQVYKEVEEKDDDGKVRVVRKFHAHVAPDRAVQKELLDRLVGRSKQPSPIKDDTKAARPVPAHEKIRRTAVDHLNNIAEDAHANSGTRAKDKTKSKGPISKRLKDLALSRNRVQGA